MGRGGWQPKEACRLRSGSHALGTAETQVLLARQLTKLFGTQLVDQGRQTRCSIATTDGYATKSCVPWGENPRHDDGC